MGNAQVIRVLTVDAHPLIHAGLRHFTVGFHDIQIVGEAYDGHEALAMCERLAPEVVLLGAQLDDGDGIATLTLLKERQPHVRVIMLSSADESWLVERAIRAGASGYLLHTLSRFDLAQALRAVVTGRMAIAPEVTQQLFSSLKQSRGASAYFGEREQAILNYLVRGHTNAQIAELLNLSRSTVKYYIANMFAKLGVTCRSELVALAYECRLVIPGALDREVDALPARAAPRLPRAAKVS
jgi:DNA-binding NarL/FixJ family response regulator